MTGKIGISNEWFNTAKRMQVKIMKLLTKNYQNRIDSKKCDLFSSTYIEGEKVKLRPLQPVDDAEDCLEIMSDPLVVEWLSNDLLENEAEATALLHGYNDNDHIIPWGIEIKDTKKMIGIIWVMPVLSPNEDIIYIADMGVRLNRQYWRKGYNKEVMRLIINYCFENLQAEQICAGTWSNNNNARKSMLFHGFDLIEKRERYNSKYQEKQIVEFYAIEREKWNLNKGDRL